MGKKKNDLGPLGEHTPDDAVLPEIKEAGEHKTTRRKIIEIVRKEGEIKRKKLEERLDVTTARISQLVDSLEEKGWLRREGKRGRTSNRKLVFTGKFETFFKIVERLDKLCRDFEKLDDADQYETVLKIFGSVVLGGLKEAKEEETEKMKDGILRKQFLLGLENLIPPQNMEEILENTEIKLGETETSGLEVVKRLFSKVEEQVKTPPSERYGGESDE